MPELKLGTERDACKGSVAKINPPATRTSIKVKDSSNNWIHVTTRDKQCVIDVTVDKDGWWYWKCLLEDGKEDGHQTRAPKGERFKVNRVKVKHGSDGGVYWETYQVT